MFRNLNHTQEYIYDFAEDGGVVGVIALSAKANHNPLPAGAIVTKVGLKVLDAVVGSSSTVAVGNTTDPDGFMEAIAEATLVADYVTATGVQAGVLLWDDTNDHDIPFLVSIGDADDADFQITIGTNALTAGKILFWVEYYMPSED